MKQPHISCPRCNGAGEIKLTKALRSTLQTIQRLESPTARQIHTALKESGHVSATHRRCERLLDLNLIEQHKHKVNGKDVEATYSGVK